jgi:hypothetical protein
MLLLNFMSPVQLNIFNIEKGIYDVIRHVNFIMETDV